MEQCEGFKKLKKMKNENRMREMGTANKRYDSRITNRVTFATNKLLLCSPFLSIVK